MLAALGGGMRVIACGLDDLIACGLTQVVAALSLRPSALRRQAHQLDPRDPTRLDQGDAAYAAAMMLGLITKSDCSTD